MSETKPLALDPKPTLSRSGNAVTIRTSNEGLKEVLQKAHKGDPSALPELRKLLDHPGAVDILGGDLARETQSLMIRKYAGKDLVCGEALPRKLDTMRAELNGPSPSPLERLVVERILSCWLHLHQLEAAYHGRDSMTLDLGDYYQRNIARANKNYLAAIKALATIRKLALPALQVNIAKRQVNVLNTAPSEREGTSTAP